MKIKRTFTNDEIIEIIQENTGIDKEDLYEDEMIEFVIDGFAIAVDYFRPQLELGKFNEIWDIS